MGLSPDDKQATGNEVEEAYTYFKQPPSARLNPFLDSDRGPSPVPTSAFFISNALRIGALNARSPTGIAEIVGVSSEPPRPSTI